MAGDFNITISVKGRAETEDNKEKDVLNIFSVASGHLYERFLR